MIRYMNEKLENMKPKPVILVVLGPHRSGTSALTGVLSHLGANLPKHLMPANEGNSLGYFESSRVKTFNDGLLSKMGSSWSDISRLDLTSVPEQERENLLDQAVELLKAEFNDARTPILKDPRICRLVDFWRMAFDRSGYRPIYIHTHRNPLETARSLAARHPIPVEIGLLIWLRHVLDAEAATRNEPRAFTNYPALLENWREQVSKIEVATNFSFHLNTPAIQKEINTFLSEDLRHQIHRSKDVRQSAQIADLVREAFEIFEGWTECVENPEDYHRLDRLRAHLDGSVGVISSFVQILERGNAQRKSLEAQRIELEQNCAQIEAERSRLAAELDRLREKGARRTTDYMAKLSELERELCQRCREAEQLLDTNRQLTGTVEALKAENLRLTEETEAEQQRFEDGIRSRDDAVQALEANVEERFREIARISENMLETSQQLENELAQRAELEQDCAQMEVERSRLAAELDRLRKEAGDMRVQIDALLASTSWRITGPLRRLVALIRR